MCQSVSEDEKNLYFVSHFYQYGKADKCTVDNNRMKMYDSLQTNTERVLFTSQRAIHKREKRRCKMIQIISPLPAANNEWRQKEKKNENELGKRIFAFGTVVFPFIVYLTALMTCFAFFFSSSASL